MTSSKTDFIANAFDLPCPPKAEVINLEGQGERCILTGEPLTEGYRVLDAVSKTTNDFEFLWDAHNRYMSINAARCFQGSNPRAKPKPQTVCSRAFAVVDGVGYEPLISDTAAIEQGRPWWAQFVKDLWPKHAGDEVLFMLSTDTKTRVWHQPHVRVGRLGANTPVTIYDAAEAINRTVEVNWPEMLADLALAEEIVSAGFWNKFLKSSLFELRKALGIPLTKIVEWEAELQTMRTKPHFHIIYLITREIEELKTKWVTQETETASPSSAQKQPQLTLF